MAFTDTQKDQIRRYLGYSAAFRDQNYQLESMMDTVGANAVEQASVEAILTEIAALDTVLSGVAAAPVEAGNLKKADEVEYYPGYADPDRITTTKRAKIAIERLRQRFGVPLAGMYFGTGESRSFDIQLG
jgi:hypothetical protein